MSVPFVDEVIRGIAFFQLLSRTHATVFVPQLRYQIFYFLNCEQVNALSLKVRTMSDAPHRSSTRQTAPMECVFFKQGWMMNKNDFFNDLQSKINQAIENSPMKDVEKNVKALMSQGFSKLDLVTREEFDIQAQVLAKTRAKLEALEARVNELEAQLKKP